MHFKLVRKKRFLLSRSELSFVCSLGRQSAIFDPVSQTDEGNWHDCKTPSLSGFCQVLKGLTSYCILAQNILLLLFYINIKVHN